MPPAALSASLSFLSNGLDMYYYANVNFDTEFKKRLLDFFFLFLIIIASSFCNVTCNYAFCKRGEERAHRGRKWLCILFYGFCVHGGPCPGGEGE